MISINLGENLSGLYTFISSGDTVYYKFTSDSSNNDWGFKFTVIGNRLGRWVKGQSE